jgi:SOS-response transcriptional repressor LexA
MTMFFLFAAGMMMERMQSSSKGETLLLQPMIGTKGISFLLQITRETFIEWTGEEIEHFLQHKW